MPSKMLIIICMLLNYMQGRRRLLKSGPAMKGQRHSRVPKARVGGEQGGSGDLPRERGVRKGGSGDLPRENVIFSDLRRNDFNAL